MVLLSPMPPPRMTTLSSAPRGGEPIVICPRVCFLPANAAVPDVFNDLAEVNGTTNAEQGHAYPSTLDTTTARCPRRRAVGEQRGLGIKNQELRVQYSSASRRGEIIFVPGFSGLSTYPCLRVAIVFEVPHTSPHTDINTEPLFRSRHFE